MNRIYIFLITLSLVLPLKLWSQNGFSPCISFPSGLMPVIAITVNDFDNDGDNDAVVGTGDNYGAVRLEFISDSIGFIWVGSLPYTSVGYSSIISGDINGDNNIDIILSKDAGSTGIYWYNNTDGLGNFQFESNYIIDASFSSYYIVCADIDMDGDNDIIVRKQNTIVWYENTNGLGTFTSAILLADSLFSITSLKVSDLDNDGDSDIIVSDYGNKQIVWYENLTGNAASWQKNIIATTYENPTGADIADIDGDGSKDILVVTKNDQLIFWYKNLGGGNFSNTNYISSTFTSVENVFLADIDNDNDIDIIAASCYHIAWYNNDGLGNFNGPFTVVDDFDYPFNNCAWKYSRILNIADINNDGFNDVITLDGADGPFAGWYKNIMTSNSITINECGSYTSPSGNYTWTETGVYFDTLTNAQAGDSVITIILSIGINNSIYNDGNVLSAVLSGATYQWLNCDSSYAEITGETNQSYTPSSNGNYAVIVNDNVCIDTTECMSYSALNVSNIEINDKIIIYPNPTTGLITIKNEKLRIMSVEVFDIYGKEVVKSEVGSAALSLSKGHKTEVDLSSQPKGIYIIKVQTSRGVAVEKVILE